MARVVTERDCGGMRYLTLLALVLALPAAASAGTVKTAFNAKLEQAILVDARGRTLYLFTEDKGDSSPACYRNLPAPGCGEEWPALLAPVTAGHGVKAALLGTEKRPDGSLQATYAGYPLYAYAGNTDDGPGDKKPGDLHGQGLYDRWWAVAPSGKPVKH